MIESEVLDLCHSDVPADMKRTENLQMHFQYVLHFYVENSEDVHTSIAQTHAEWKI